MKLYDNGIFMWDNLVLGMCRGLVAEAIRRYQEDDLHCEDIDAMIDKIDETTIDRDVVEYFVHTVKYFYDIGVLKESSDGFDFFFQLYIGKIPYEHFSDNRPEVSISIYDDIRVFFE